MEAKDAVVVVNVAAPIVVLLAPGHEVLGHQQRVRSAVNDMANRHRGGNAVLAGDVVKGSIAELGRVSVILDVAPVDDVVAAGTFVIGGVLLIADVAGAVVEVNDRAAEAVHAV